MSPLSKAPPESLLSALLRAADAFLHLSCSDDVFDAYLNIQESLVDVIESAPDPMPYGNSWSLISLPEQTELLNAQKGNQESLLRLKQTVSQGIEYLP